MFHLTFSYLSIAYAYFAFPLFEYCVICNLRYHYFTMGWCVTTLRYVTTRWGCFLQHYDITSLLRMVCLTTTSRHYYEWVVLLRHHVTTKNGLFYYDITSLLRMGCLLRHHVTTTNGLFYYITSLLRRGCFTTTSRHYVPTTNGLFTTTCVTTPRHVITTKGCFTTTLHFCYELIVC